MPKIGNASLRFRRPFVHEGSKERSATALAPLADACSWRAPRDELLPGGAEYGFFLLEDESRPRAGLVPAGEQLFRKLWGD